MKTMATAGAVLLGLGVTLAHASPVAPGDVKVDENKVAASVSGAAGNAENGAKVFSDRGLGNCLACHAVSAKS